MNAYLLHFAVCVIMSLVVALGFNELLSIPVVLVIGIGKELFDKYIKKTFFDKLDLLFDLLGGIFGLELLTIL